jgi:hypothetical protein
MRAHSKSRKSAGVRRPAEAVKLILRATDNKADVAFLANEENANALIHCPQKLSFLNETPYTANVQITPK